MSHSHEKHSEIKHERIVSHEHHHDHEGNLTLILYLVGVAFFILGFIAQKQVILADILFALSFLLAGYHVISEGIVETIIESKEKRKFRPNIHILMTLAGIGSLLLGDFEEGSLLILIFAGAHFLEEYAEGKSRREISNLLKLNPTSARRLLKDGSVEVVDVSDLKIGDQIQVLNGGQIPTDGRILSGATTINESSINGESMPKEKLPGDEVYGSTINGAGVIIFEVTKDSSDTVFAKILELVNQSQTNVSKTASKIKKIEPIYVTIVLAAFPIVILLGPVLFGWDWQESIYRGLVFLITTSPCALAASAVPATLSAISNLAKKGVLFKGGSYLSNLAELKTIAFDKTGTLTAGKPEVVAFDVIMGEELEEVKEVVFNMERQSNHPLAEAVRMYLEGTVEMKEIEIENQVGSGLQAKVGNDFYEIKKPSLFTSIPRKAQEIQLQLAKEGKTVVFIAKNQEVIGWMAFMDRPNDKAKKAIHYFNQQGIQTIMITGDGVATGEAVGKEIGVSRVVANVLPEQKSAIIKEQQKNDQDIVGMVGDGVNDAPALVQSNIGIAMGEGTDVAIDVADVVIMKNDLEKLIEAHHVSKRLNRIVWENMVFSMLVVMVLMVLNFMQIADINFGVIAHEGSTLVVIFNGLRMLRSKNNLIR